MVRRPGGDRILIKFAVKKGGRVEMIDASTFD